MSIIGPPELEMFDILPGSGISISVTITYVFFGDMAVEVIFSHSV